MRTLRSLLVIGLLVGLTGCTGSPSSTSAWSDKTDKTIGQAVSSLGTARVVLEADRQHHVTHSYAVGALTDAVEVADKEVGKYDAMQPPDGRHRLAHHVVAELHEAVRLLGEIRTAYASPGTDDAQGAELLTRIKDTLDRLDTLTTTVDGATS
jgi:hypothetical protein